MKGISVSSVPGCLNESWATG